MKDLIIYSADWIISASQDKKMTAERIKKYNVALLQFLSENHLLKNPESWSNFEEWNNFLIKVSSLTDVGYRVIKESHDKWLRKIDSGEIQPENTTLLNEKLDELQASIKKYKNTPHPKK